MQIRAGEVPESARSITSDNLKDMYLFNEQYKPQFLAERLNLDPNNVHNWGGGRLRIMLQLAYSIAFLCLLRFDEMLNIKMENLRVIDTETGQWSLMLEARKTHQHGGKLGDFIEPNATNMTVRNQALPLLVQPLRTTSGRNSPSFALAVRFGH